MPEETRLIGTFWQSSKIDLVAQQLSFSLRLVATSGLASELANCVHRSVALDTPARNALLAPAPVARGGGIPTDEVEHRLAAARGVTGRDVIGIARQHEQAGMRDLLLPGTRLVD